MPRQDDFDTPLAHPGKDKQGEPPVVSAVSCTSKVCVLLVLAADLLLTGVIFGWAAMKQVLVNETQFDRLCFGNKTPGGGGGGDSQWGNSSSSSSSSSTTAAFLQNNSGLEEVICADQATMFSLVFTAGSTVLAFGSLPVGFFLDLTGPVQANVAGCVFTVGGLLMFGLADSVMADLGWMFPVSYAFLGFGGCLTMLSSFPAAFLWPSSQTAILAAISCLFDASSVVFAIMAQLFFADPHLFQRRNVFSLYAVLAFALYLAVIFSWVAVNKKTKQETEAQQAPAEPQESDNGDTLVLSGPTQRSIRNGEASVVKSLQEKNLCEQIRSYEFVVVLVFASLHMLRCNYFINNVDEMLYAYDAPGFGYYQLYTTVFSFILPVGVVFIPVIDICVKKLGLVGTLHVTNVIGVVVGALSLVPNVHVQIANFLMFAMFRAFLYGIVGAFIAQTFGLKTLGRITGTVYTLAAAINLLQYVGEYVTAEVFQGNIQAVTVFMLCLNVAPVALVAAFHVHLKRRTRRTISKHAPKAAVHAHDYGVRMVDLTAVEGDFGDDLDAVSARKFVRI